MNNDERIDIYAELPDLIETLEYQIDKLFSAGTQLQIQPNGFLRLSLAGQKNSDNGLFLHAWHPALPTQRFLHTHVFDMTSRIIIGSLEDQVYEVIEESNGPYQLVKSNCTQNDCTITEIMTAASLKPIRTLKLNSGDCYTVPKGQFHSTVITSKTKTALTLIQKSNTANIQPILAIPSNTAIPWKPFSRNDIEQDFAWETIKKLLKNASSGEVI